LVIDEDMCVVLQDVLREGRLYLSGDSPRLRGEPEALLALDLLRREPQVVDRRVRHGLDRLAPDGESPAHLGRHRLAGLDRSGDLDALDVEDRPPIRLVALAVEKSLAPHRD